MIANVEQDRFVSWGQQAAQVEDQAPARDRTMARRVSLPDALEAPRRETFIEGVGRVSYYASEAGTGRPLVLIHSINAAPSAYEMKPLFDRYRSHRPIYALDLPGFGFSERTDRVYSPELFSSAITEFLRQTVRKRADLVALSLGCEFAARVAQSAPDLVASLTLLSPTGFSSRTMKGGETGKRIHKFLSVPGLSQGLFDLLTVKGSVRYFLSRSFAGSVPEHTVDYAYATAHQPGARYAPLYFLSGQLFTRDAPERLYAGVSQPVLVVYDRDPNIDFKHLSGFLAGRANWRAERIAPTKGLPHWEKPEETTAAMERLWSESP